jgi:hypothetical protein
MAWQTGLEGKRGGVLEICSFKDLQIYRFHKYCKLGWIG